MKTKKQTQDTQLKKQEDFNPLKSLEEFKVIMDGTEYEFIRPPEFCRTIPDLPKWWARTRERGVVVGNLRYFAKTLWCCESVCERDWFSKPSCSWWPHNP